MGEGPDAINETVREWGRRCSNWGRFGKDDERGTLNFATPERVLAACAAARPRNLLRPSLQRPRTAERLRQAHPIHTLLADGGDALRGAQDFISGAFRYADD